MNQSSYSRNLFFDPSPALFSLLCAGLLIFGVAFFICFRQYETVKSNSLNADKTAASLVATVLAGHEETGAGVLVSYAQRPLLVKAVTEKDLAAIHYNLEEMKRNHPAIDLIFLTDKDGTIRANYPIFPEAIGQNVSSRDWYQGVSARWEPYTSAVFQLIVADKPLASATAAPILDEKGEVVGILGNSHRLDYIAKIIQSTYLNPDAAVNVIDQKGHLLFSNKYPFRDKIAHYPLLPIIQQAIKRNEHLIEAPEQSGSDGKSYLTQFPVERVGWTVIVERRHEDILRSTYQSFYEIGAIAILLVSLAGSFVFYQRKVVLLRKTEELLHSEQKLRESEQAELETRIKAEHEIQKAEKALREREEQLRLFVEHAPAAIAMFDVQMRYIAVSRRWLADYGLTGQEVLGRSHYEIFPEIPQRWKEIHHRCMAGVVERSEEDPFKRDDGSVQWLRWEVRPWELSSGIVGGIVIFSEDITERKRAEKAVRKERDFSTAVLDTAGALVIVLDKEGKITRFNPACEQITGYTVQEVLGRVFLDFLVPPEEIGGVRQAWNALRAGDFPNQHENHWVAKDGTRRLIAWSNTAITRSDGEIDYIIGTGVDITERKRAEENLRHSEESLRQANEGLEQRVQERGPGAACAGAHH